MSILRGLRLFAVFLILSATVALAQQLSISGTVRDASGVVPDATVTLRAGGSAPRVTSTDPMGRYAFTGLPPTYYEISFAKGGFETVTRNLALNPDSGTLLRHRSAARPNRWTSPTTGWTADGRRRIGSAA